MSSSYIRPLSPHIQIYKWQMTSVLSILHRFTGMSLCVGIMGLVGWLYLLTLGPVAYLKGMAILKSLPGQMCVWSIIFSGQYHFANGIRHLIWDVGYGFSLPIVYRSGWFIVGFSFVSTLLLFLGR